MNDTTHERVDLRKAIATAATHIAGTTAQELASTSVRAALPSILEQVRAAQHLPVIAETSTPGVWHTYCLACSDEQGDWIWPCDLNPQHRAPKEVAAADGIAYATLVDDLSRVDWLVHIADGLFEKVAQLASCPAAAIEHSIGQISAEWEKRRGLETTTRNGDHS